MTREHDGQRPHHAASCLVALPASAAAQIGENVRGQTLLSRVDSSRATEPNANRKIWSR
jgi:hypothetical protein